MSEYPPEEQYTPPSYQPAPPSSTQAIISVIVGVVCLLFGFISLCIFPFCSPVFTVIGATIGLILGYGGKKEIDQSGGVMAV